VATPVFPTTAARAWIVASCGSEGPPSRLLFFRGINPHDPCEHPAPVQHIGHDVHGLVNVSEKRPPCTEVVQPQFAVGRCNKAVFGTLSTTRKAHRTLKAVARERLNLRHAKLPLLVGGHKLAQRCVEHVAEAIVWLDKVTTRVEVTVVLECKGYSTRRREDAHCRRRSRPRSECCVEELHEHAADIAIERWPSNI
jgi:hypothetical protein